MFDFIKNPFKSDDSADVEAQAKKDRIEFHRKSVRNGPVNFKTPTSGQFRRAHDRSIQRNIKRTRRAQVRQFLQDQRQAAVVRGKLNIVGIGVSNSEGKPYLSGFQATQKQFLDASRWLITHFAHAEVGETIEISEKAILDSFREALNHWQRQVGLPQTDLPTGFSPSFEFAA